MPGKHIKIFILSAVIFAGFLSLSSFCVTFAVLGDNRNGDAIFSEIISKINNDKEIEFVMTTGDLTPSGTRDEYDNYYKLAGQCRVRIYDCMGNHDIGRWGSGTKIFNKKNGNPYYYFDKDGCRFIVLDNSGRSMGRKQISWLEKALEHKGAIFVFIHKPLFDPTGNFPKYIMLNKSERNILYTLFRRAKVNCVFVGHIHGYGKGVDRGVVEILTAGAGAPLYLPRFSGGFNHYVKVKYENGVFSDEVVKLSDDK